MECYVILWENDLNVEALNSGLRHVADRNEQPRIPIIQEFVTGSDLCGVIITPVRLTKAQLRQFHGRSFPEFDGMHGPLRIAAA